MKANEQLAIQKTNQIISRFQHGVSTNKEIRRIIKKFVVVFSASSLFTTSIYYLVNQLKHDSLIGTNTALFVIGFWAIMYTFIALGQISQLPGRPLGQTIYQWYVNFINRHAPGQQTVHQFTVTVTENKRK